MNVFRLIFSFFVGGGVLAASAIQPAAADAIADFYKNRTVTLYVGYGPGAGYDTYARTVARHLGKHIPGNPNVIVVNRPGAGSLVLTNELYNVMPKDGTAFGLVARGVAMEPLLGNEKAKFDARNFSWIGSANKEVSLCIAWHNTPIRTFEDLFTEEMLVGGIGGDTNTFPKVLNHVLGTKLKLIAGYAGGGALALAMEQGEVQGRCGLSWSTAKSHHWIAQEKVRILVQMSLEKHPDLPNVPLIMDYTKDADARNALALVFAPQVMGRPFVAPPGVPADRVTALRDAFMATMKDPQFLAEAKKQKLEINPASGEQIAKLLRDIYGSSPRAVAIAREAISGSAR